LSINVLLNCLIILLLLFLLQFIRIWGGTYSLPSIQHSSPIVSQCPFHNRGQWLLDLILHDFPRELLTHTEGWFHLNLKLKSFTTIGLVLFATYFPRRWALYIFFRMLGIPISVSQKSFIILSQYSLPWPLNSANPKRANCYSYSVLGDQ
jgi:hypothetical protein